MDEFDVEGLSIAMLDPEDLEVAHDHIWYVAETVREVEPWESMVLRVIAKDLVERNLSHQWMHASQRWWH